MRVPLFYNLIVTFSLLLSINLYASVDIFVKRDSGSIAPYYSFYKDANGTVPYDIVSGGNESLYIGETYTFSFQATNEFFHPFYVSDNGYEGSSNHLTLAGDGSPTNGIIGTQSFTMTINESFDTNNDVLNFYCSSHTNMVGSFNVSLGTSSSNPLIGTSDLFENTTNNSTWTRFIASALASDGGSSQAEQIIKINVTNLPVGSQYRIVKTVSNGSWYTANGQNLALGLNIITVPAVSFDRTVKVQFNKADTEFDSLVVNGVALYGEASSFIAPSGSVLASTQFTSGTSNYPYVYSSTTIGDGISSQAEQTFTLNVTALPEGGANYSVYKTTANGNDFFADPVALTLGENTISVAAVEFDRGVKLRLSADIAIDQFIVNGNYIVGTAPVIAPILAISSNAGVITLEWTDTAGFELQYSNDLNSWTSTGDSVSPYSELLETSKFFRLSNE